MRKLLLITAVLFSLGSMAQRPLDFTKNIRTFNKNLKLNSLMSQMPTSHIAKPAKAQAKAPAKAPEGESRTYYLDFYNQCYGVGIVPEVHKAVNIIFGSENKVYIQNMMYPSEFNTYIEGELNGNVITIKNGQLIGEIQGYNMVLCNMVLDETTGQISLDTSNDFTLTIDENYGIITSDITGFIGIFTEDYQLSYTCSGMMQFTPAELYPEADEHEYTYDYEAYSTPLQTNKKGTVQIINLGQYSYIKGLMPEEAPDAWLMAVNENGSSACKSARIIGNVPEGQRNSTFRPMCTVKSASTLNLDGGASFSPMLSNRMAKLPFWKPASPETRIRPGTQVKRMSQNTSPSATTYLLFTSAAVCVPSILRTKRSSCSGIQRLK